MGHSILQLEKVRVSERQRSEQLLLQQGRLLFKAVDLFIQSALSSKVMAVIREKLTINDIQGAVAVLDKLILTLSSAIPQMFVAAATAEMSAKTPKHAKTSIAKASDFITMDFDPSDPTAAAIMRASRLSFIQQFTDAQRNATRVALANVFARGGSTADAARAFSNSIGLTQSQVESVENYRRLLEQNSVDALSRALRDRRFDPSVERAIDLDEPLDSSKIDRMVERYRQRYLQHRAEMIARTESLRVVSEARQEAARQLLSHIGASPDQVKRTWIATHDKRTRDSHRHMDGQVVYGLDTPFTTPSGHKLQYPGDPSGPAEEVINCFVAGTEVAGTFIKGLKTWYSGPIREINTARGNRLRVTPNHPILTTEGWVAAKDLTKAHTLFYYTGKVNVATVPNVYSKNCPALIEDVFQALRTCATTFIPARDTYLHGDAKFGDSNIEIVGSHGEFKFDYVSLLFEGFSYFWNKITDSVLIVLLPFRSMYSFFDRILFASACNPSFSQKLSSKNIFVATLFNPLPTMQHCLRTIGIPSPLHLFFYQFRRFFQFFPKKLFAFRCTSDDFSFLQQSPYRAGAYTNLARDFSDGSSIHVELDNIIGIRDDDFSGHVYDLQSVPGWYLANHTVVSNCRCTVVIDVLSQDELDEEAA